MAKEKRSVRGQVRRRERQDSRPGEDFPYDEMMDTGHYALMKIMEALGITSQEDFPYVAADLSPMTTDLPNVKGADISDLLQSLRTPEGPSQRPVPAPGRVPGPFVKTTNRGDMSRIDSSGRFMGVVPGEPTPHGVQRIQKNPNLWLEQFRGEGEGIPYGERQEWRRKSQFYMPRHSYLSSPGELHPDEVERRRKQGVQGQSTRDLRRNRLRKSGSSPDRPIDRVSSWLYPKK